MNGVHSPPRGSAPRWSQLALLGVLLFALQIPFYWEYLTDDTYIYARFARNLAQHGEFAFNLGEPVHAATSPLWAALGALGVLMGVDAFLWLKLLAWLCAIGALMALAGAVVRALPGGPQRWLAMALLATEPWFVRWSGSGMETALGVLVVALLLYEGMGAAAGIRWSRLAWVAGLGPLVRPELILLTGLIGAGALFTPSARRRPGFWLGLLAPMALWSALALPLYGHVFPQTLQAKSTPLGLEPGRLLANVRVMGVQFLLAAALPCLLLLFFWRPRRFRPAFHAAPWIEPIAWFWVVALPLIYLLRDVQVVSRYLELILPAIILLAMMRLAAWRRGRAIILGLLGAEVIVALLLTTLWISPSTRAFSRSADRALGDISRWLVENSGPESVVAIYDIGIVGYRTERRILDLGGLIEPGINELRDRIDDEEILRGGHFLRFGQPEYLVHRDGRPESLRGLALGARTLRPILHRPVANLGLSRPDSVHYTLYRFVAP